MSKKLKDWFENITNHADSPLQFLPNGSLMLAMGEGKCAITAITTKNEYVIGFTGLKEKPKGKQPLPDILHFGIYTNDVESIHALKKICEGIIEMDAKFQLEKANSANEVK